MSQNAPLWPYVYQPFGMRHKDHWRAARIYAIGGLPPLCEVTGLTKNEAEEICLVFKRFAAVKPEDKAAEKKGEE